MEEYFAVSAMCPVPLCSPSPASRVLLFSGSPATSFMCAVPILRPAVASGLDTCCQAASWCCFSVSPGPKISVIIPVSEMRLLGSHLLQSCSRQPCSRKLTTGSSQACGSPFYLSVIPSYLLPPNAPLTVFFQIRVPPVLPPFLLASEMESSVALRQPSHCLGSTFVCLTPVLRPSAHPSRSYSRKHTPPMSRPRLCSEAGTRPLPSCPRGFPSDGVTFPTDKLCSSSPKNSPQTFCD